MTKKAPDWKTKYPLPASALQRAAIQRTKAYGFHRYDFTGWANTHPEYYTRNIVTRIETKHGDTPVSSKPEYALKSETETFEIPEPADVLEELNLPQSQFHSACGVLVVHDFPSLADHIDQRARNIEISETIKRKWDFSSYPPLRMPTEEEKAEWVKNWTWYVRGEKADGAWTKAIVLATLAEHQFGDWHDTLITVGYVQLSQFINPNTGHICRLYQYDLNAHRVEMGLVPIEQLHPGVAPHPDSVEDDIDVILEDDEENEANPW